MVEQMAPAYMLSIESSDKPVRVPKSITDELKGTVSAKMISRMKKEVVSCPVQNKSVCFLECFNCRNFMHRTKGQLGCKGQP